MFTVKLSKEDLEDLQKVCDKAQEKVREKDKSCIYEIIHQDGEVYVLESSSKARIPYHVVKNPNGRITFARVFL